MKKSLGITMFLLMAIGIATLGLAADQTVNVIIPASSALILSDNEATITFPSIETWTADSATAVSEDFSIITHHNGSNNPDILVTSTDLSNGDGATLDRSRFLLYVTPHQQAERNAALNAAFNITDIGRGRKVANAHYGLTIDADQQSGTYTGTVTFTLVNQ